MTRRTLEIAAFIAAVLIAATALHAWLASRDEQARLAATLAAQTKVLDAASSRERARQSALNDTLAQIDKLKRETLTPAQILRALQQYLPLPEPLTMAPAAGSAASAAATASAGVSKKGTALPQEYSSGRPLARATTPDLAVVAPSSGSSAATRDLPAASTWVGGGGTMSSLPSATHDLPAAPSAQIPADDLKPLYDYVQDCRACQAQLAAAKQDKADDDAQIAALVRERDAAVAASKGGAFLRRLRRNALWFLVGAGVGAAADYAASNR